MLMEMVVSSCSEHVLVLLHPHPCIDTLAILRKGPGSRVRPHSLKRKSVGQAIGRSISSQNLYSTNVQHQQQYHHPQHSLHRDNHHATEPRDLNSAMPRSSIKMTSYPNGSSSSSSKSSSSPVTTTLDTTEAMTMQLNQSSRIVIEIRQPRSTQSYNSATNLHEQVKDITGHDNVVGNAAVTAPGQGTDLAKSMTMYRSSSHPNLQLSRSSSSVLGHGRSPSPDVQAEDREDFGGPSAKKRKADTGSVPSASGHGVNEESFVEHTVQKPSVPSAHSPAIQVIGVDYIAKSDEAVSKEGVGLGLSVQSNKTLTSSPTTEAFRVARGSSYVNLEDQKEMGLDYSQFTRVETAGWRILIPPNVVASFRSDDFGLMLKPKGLEEDEVAASGDVETSATMMDERRGILDQRKSDGYQRQRQILIEAKEEEEDVNVEGVSRIALRDDDRDELAATAAASIATSSAAGVTTLAPGRRKQQDDDQDMDEDDVDMGKDQDELLEDN